MVYALDVLASSLMSLFKVGSENFLQLIMLDSWLAQFLNSLKIINWPLLTQPFPYLFTEAEDGFVAGQDIQYLIKLLWANNLSESLDLALLLAPHLQVLIHKGSLCHTAGNPRAFKSTFGYFTNRAANLGVKWWPGLITSSRYFMQQT